MIGIGSLILDRALEYPHRRGEKICVVRATSTELRAFRQREHRLYMRHKIVEVCISRAVVLGEEILRARRMQRSFETRPVPKPVTPYYLFVIKA